MTVDYIWTHLSLSLILLILYIGWYRGQIAFTKNRIILLSSLFLSLVVPLLSFDVFPVESAPMQISSSTPSNTYILEETQSSFSLLTWIYLSGILAYLCWIAWTCFNIWKKLNKYQFIQQEKGIYLAEDANVSGFSFWNKMVLQSLEDPLIRHHESIHLKKKHTFDLLLMHLLTAFAWYNPLHYWWHKYIIENHEYEADYNTCLSMKLHPYDYAKRLLQIGDHRELPMMAHSFAKLIKRRLQLLSTLPKYSKMKYLFAIPIFFLLAFSFTAKSYPVIDEEKADFAVDTLPDSIFINDTIISFDYDTYVESVKVVKSKTSLDEVLKSIPVSGMVYNTIDTTTTYNYNSQKITIEEDIYQFPKEYLPIFDQLDYKQRIEFAKKYGQYKHRLIKEE